MYFILRYFVYYSGILFAVFFLSGRLLAQPYLGFRLGIGGNTVRYESADFLRDHDYEVKPHLGIVGGMSLHYRVKSRWSLRLDLDYAERGRTLQHKGTFYAQDRLRNQHIDGSLLFQHVFGTRRLRAHIGIGPVLSGWLRSRGEFSSANVLLSSRKKQLNYGIDLSIENSLANDRNPPTPNPKDDLPLITINKVGLFQWGLTVGSGLIIPLDNQKLLLIDFRYMHIQTHFGRNNDNYDNQLSGFLNGLSPNYEMGYRGINLSIGLVFGLGQPAFGPPL